jgi:predicted RNA-binding protein
MCESTAYIKRGDKEEMIFEDVAHVLPQGDTVILTGVLGKRMELKATIDEMDLMAHKIILKEAE